METPPVQLTLWGLLIATLLASVVTDLLWRRILDVVTWPSMALALGGRTAFGGWGEAEGWGAASGLLGLVVTVPVFALMAWRGRMGWGDVKLMGVVGAAMGYPAAMTALVLISLTGALQAIVALMWQGAVWDTVAAALRRWAAKVRLVKGGAEGEARHIPYGVAIAVGAVWALFWEQSNR